MGVSYYPSRGPVKSIQEVNATFTTTNTGAVTTYEVALATTVNKSKSVFVPTAGAGGRSINRDDTSGFGCWLHGLTIKSDGTALQIRILDTAVATHRVTGTVIEYY